MIDKRKDYKTRVLFDNTIINLKDILSCYDEVYHYKVLNNYLKAYNLFKGSDSIRGRIIVVLKARGYNV